MAPQRESAYTRYKYRSKKSTNGVGIKTPLQGQSPLTQGWRYRAARDKASRGFSVVAQLLLKRNAVLYTAVSANVVECGTLLTI